MSTKRSHTSLVALTEYGSKNTLPDVSGTVPQERIGIRWVAIYESSSNFNRAHNANRSFFWGVVKMNGVVTTSIAAATSCGIVFVTSPTAMGRVTMVSSIVW